MLEHICCSLTVALVYSGEWPLSTQTERVATLCNITCYHDEGKGKHGEPYAGCLRFCPEMTKYHFCLSHTPEFLRIGMYNSPIERRALKRYGIGMQFNSRSRKE